MAKSIKSFNATDEVLGIIKEANPDNTSEWVNRMIKKGYMAEKNPEKDPSIPQMKITKVIA